MNGKTARTLRQAAGNPGEIEYQIVPGSRRWKSARVTGPDVGGGVETNTIRLNPECGRRRYQNYKRLYIETRKGTLLAGL